MPPKRKGATAEDKIEAPPAKTIKGKKENKSEKTLYHQTKVQLVRQQHSNDGKK